MFVVQHSLRFTASVGGADSAQLREAGRAISHGYALASGPGRSFESSAGHPETGIWAQLPGYPQLCGLSPLLPWAIGAACPHCHPGKDPSGGAFLPVTCTAHGPQAP
jgi:hypothetical protein